jgi:integrase
MDALIAAAKRRGRQRDLAIFLLLRYTGMRRGSVASVRVRHLDEGWGLRGVRVKGGKTQDLPLPATVKRAVAFYEAHAVRMLTTGTATETPVGGMNRLRLQRRDGESARRGSARRTDLILALSICAPWTTLGFEDNGRMS